MQRFQLHLISDDKLTTAEGAPLEGQVPGLETQMEPLIGHVGGGQSTWTFPFETLDCRPGAFHVEA